MSRTRFWIEGLLPTAILLLLVSILAPANGQNFAQKIAAAHVDVQVAHADVQLVKAAVPALVAGADAHAVSQLLQKAGLSVGNIRCGLSTGAPGRVTRFSPV